jgi:hypothetical protein
MNDSSKNQDLLKERRWECGWDEHEALQRRRLSCLSLSEKLLWLEQAQRTVIHLQASRPESSDSSGD